MARFGKKTVEIPSGVEVKIEGSKVLVKGPKGSLERTLPRAVSIDIKDNSLTVNIKKESKQNKALQGTIRSHILNMITGVTDGWTKVLEINGAGYRAEVKGNTLVMMIGYSHPVEIEAPEAISFKVEKNTITVEGPNKDVVGQVSAIIRSKRKPEPYKGAGIKYQDEVIRRKAGKQATGTAA